MPDLRALATSLAAAAAVLALAGCGGDDEDPAARTATFGAGEEVRVAGGEYFFDPDSVVVESGPGPLQVTLENEGSIAHNLTVFEGETEIGGTPTFTPGQSRSAEVDLEPGTYRMVCTVADHAELGMVGELEVR